MEKPIIVIRYQLTSNKINKLWDHETRSCSKMSKSLDISNSRQNYLISLLLSVQGI